MGAVKANGSARYTLRKVPANLDRALRRKAQREGKSLNAIALEALSVGLGLSGKTVQYGDLDFIFGSWIEDPREVGQTDLSS